MAVMKSARSWAFAASTVGAALMWLYATAAFWTQYLPDQRALPTVVGIVIDMPHAQLARTMAAAIAVALTTVVGFRLFQTTGAFLAVWIALFGFLALFFAAPKRPADLIYQAHRADFRQVADLATSGDLTDKTAYGNDLSLRLRYLSTTGRVNWVGSSLFVPRRVVFPNNSAGFWYVPKGSPLGKDMFGTECSDPVRLDGHWWACGLPS